jgi:hypothetical protein
VPSGSIGDHLRTPPVARAITSPWTWALAAGGAVVGFLAGGILGAVALGALAGAARVGVAGLRRPARPRIDPFTLGEPWKRLVQDAVQAQNRFTDIVRAARSGPTRERLDDIGGRIAEGVEDAWAIGQAGGLLTDARRRIDVGQLQRRIAEAEAGGETAAALQAQLDSAARLDATIADTRDRLHLTTARLDEAVVRAAEVAARAGDPAGLEALGSDVELLVQDLEALRQGLDEVDRPSPGTA